MKRDFAKKIAPIVKAFGEGKDIEVNIDGEWCNCHADIGLNSDYQYRIKDSTSKANITNYTVECADNGLFIECEEFAEVVEDIENKVCIYLGKLLKEDIKAAMDAIIANKVDVEIKITKHEAD